MFDGDYTLVWVLIVCIIGIAASCYSLCKGCRGNFQERGITARSLVAPYAGVLQQLRSEEAARNRLFSISGRRVQDKGPPTYDELFAPPPSYEESMRLFKGLLGFKTSPSSNSLKTESVEEQQLSSTRPCAASAATASSGAGDVTSCDNVTVVVLVDEQPPSSRREVVADIHRDRGVTTSHSSQVDNMDSSLESTTSTTTTAATAPNTNESSYRCNETLTIKTSFFY